MLNLLLKNTPVTHHRLREGLCLGNDVLTFNRQGVFETHADSWFEGGERRFCIQPSRNIILVIMLSFHKLLSILRNRLETDRSRGYMVGI